MNWNWYKVATWLPWLALPITALTYWRAWDRLPLRMAVHFDANWNPNGYTSREGALMLAMGIMAVMLIVCTVGAYAVRALKQNAAWGVLFVLYVALGFCWYGSNLIVDYNLKSNAEAPHSWNAAPRSRLDRLSPVGLGS